MASLTAALSAVRQSAGEPRRQPLQLGFPAIQLRVQAQARRAAAGPVRAFRLNLSGGGGSLLAALLALLPQSAVRADQPCHQRGGAGGDAGEALASLNWQVPLSLPVIGIGLPTCAFVAQLSATLGLQAVLSAPCPICDAAKLMAAL